MKQILLICAVVALVGGCGGKKEAGETAQKESEEKLAWEVLTETDVFPGDNAHTMSAGDLDACKQVCIDRQFGAFVTWRGTAYFRSQSPEDCKSHSEPGIHGGSTLYIRPATQNLEVGTSTSRADAGIATGTEPTSNTKEPPAHVGKELKPKDVVGSYEAGLGGITFRFVLLESGVVENYFNGIKEPEDAKWKIQGAEVHIEKGKSDGTVIVNKIEPNGDLTVFARIRNGKREDFQNRTYKKIKSENETPSKSDGNNSTTAKPVKELKLEEKVVGEYEFKNKIGLVRKDVYLANGNFENYLDGEMGDETHIHSFVGFVFMPWRIVASLKIGSSS